MKIDKIITLANERVRIPFLAMERSLRATGCKLPLYVIPFDEQMFELPDNAQWWLGESFASWLKEQGGLPVMRKYQCLLSSHYQFVDSDIIFLKNPEIVLDPYEGFITSCCHWHNPNETLTPESKDFFTKKTTVWQHQVFNTGQFACSDQLYTLETLQEVAERPQFQETCLKHLYHEQPGLNMLVFASGIPITNLTLPPTYMESTWAGDYGSHFKNTWEDEARKPYLMHWAGTKMNRSNPISELFYNYLSEEEATAFDKAQAGRIHKLSLIRRIGRAIKAGWNFFKNQ
tara:strand:+ start:12858 stop:13721 length:864 start_codon:yes stop_codon:yes gene_type:complete